MGVGAEEELEVKVGAEVGMEVLVEVLGVLFDELELEAE